MTPSKPPTPGDSAQIPIRQIIPAPGWWAIYCIRDNGYPDGFDDEIERVPLVGWALVGAREVVGLDAEAPQDGRGGGGPCGVAPCPSRSAILLGYAHENQSPYFGDDQYWLDVLAERQGVDAPPPNTPGRKKRGR